MAATDANNLGLAAWQPVSRRTVYAHTWTRGDKDVVRVPTGHETIHGVVRYADTVGVLPVVDDDHTILVQQDRSAAGRPTSEMPTGGRGPIEALDVAARRELADAARYGWSSRASHASPHVQEHGQTRRSPVPRERSQRCVRQGPRRLGRAVLPPRMGVDSVVDMVQRAEITDSMTVTVILPRPLDVVTETIQPRSS